MAGDRRATALYLRCAREGTGGRSRDGILATIAHHEPTPLSLVLPVLGALAVWPSQAGAQESWYVIGNFDQRAPQEPPGVGEPPRPGGGLADPLDFNRSGFRAEGQVLSAEELAAGPSWHTSGDLFPLTDVIGPEAGSTALMANGYYDYSVTPRWRLFAGAGLGLARLPGEGGEVPAGAAGLDAPLYQDDEAHIAYQGMLGLSYQPDDPVEIFLGYRFFAAENLGLSSSPDDGSDDAEGYSAHSGLIGFRYNF